MKTISHGQSRRNSARRRRKVKARHARGRRWGSGPKPVFGAGRIRYEIGARINAMSYGGIGVVRRLVSKLGLAGEIDRRLELLKRHLPYHESDHVLNIAYNLLCGGTRLEDLGGLRDNAAHMDALGAEVIPSPTAAGDFTRRFGEGDVIGLQEAFNAVRPQLWTGQGRDLLAPVAYIDVDGTLAPTLGDKKEGMDMSYKGVWGYHPLIVSLANTGEVLYLVNRPGNVASHKGAAEWIDRAVGLVAPHVERVCVRGDTDFSLTAHFDRWSEEADFIFGYDAQPGMMKRAEALEESDWKPLERRPRYTSRTGRTRRRRENVKARIVRERGYLNRRLNCEHVGEYEYRPGKCRETYRMVVVRRNISRMRGENALIDEFRYFFHITTRRDIGAAEVALHPRDDPAALPGHPPGTADHAAHHRLAADDRPDVQRVANDRADGVPDRLRLTPQSPATLLMRPIAPPPGPVSPAVHPLTNPRNGLPATSKFALCPSDQPETAARGLLACFGASVLSRIKH